MRQLTIMETVSFIIARAMYCEKRQSDRKALFASGDLKQGHAATAKIETINLARDGMAISAHQKIVAGEPCEVKFDMTVDGATHRLSLRATAMFCVYAGQGAYKAGLKFIDMRSADDSLISRFLAR